MPEELHKKIKELAEKEKRSLNSQIIYMLGKYLEQIKVEQK
jgi:hypothetical protein